MAKCKDCSCFFAVPDGADDYEAEKGDCVTEHKDEKGKFWLSKPVFEASVGCRSFTKRT